MFKFLIALSFLFPMSSFGITSWAVQFDNSPNAFVARNYMGTTNYWQGTNVTLTKYTDPFGNTGYKINAGTNGGGGGSGTVTSVTSGNAAPLFNVNVANTTTTPTFTFMLLYTPLNSNAVDIVAALGSTPVNEATHATTADSVTGGVINNVTNAAPSLGISPIASSNQPIVSLKSFSAGANVTLTDNGTNINIAASSSGGGSGIPDLMAQQTNYNTTFRTITSDVADGGTFAFTGFGDTLSLGFSGGTGAVIVRQNLNTSFTLGPWAELRTASASGGIAFLSSQTTGPIYPFTGGGFYFQTYIHVRNTNAVRILAGFAGGAAATFFASDTVITNSAYFRYSTAAGDGTWHGVVCNATNQTVVDTGASLVTDTDYLLQMYKTNGTTNVVFVVNRTSSAITSSNAPKFTVSTDLMYPTVGQDSLAIAIKTNWIRYISYTVDWPAK